MRNAQPTRNEVLAIIDTLEGLIRQDFSNVHNRNERTRWVCELYKLEARGQ